MGLYTPADSVGKEILTVEELDYLVHRFKDLEDGLNNEKQLKFEFPMKFDYIRKLNDFHARITSSMKMLADTTQKVNEVIHHTSMVPPKYYS